MRRILLSAPLLVGLVAGAAAQVSNPPSVNITLGGDLNGTPQAATVKKINGITPGGSCTSGQFVSSVDSSGRPSCLTPSGTVSGIGFGSGAPTSGKYVPFFGEAFQTGATGASGTARCHTVAVARTLTVKALATWITTPFSGNLQIALYNATPDGGGATTLIDKTASLSTAATGGIAGNLGSTQVLQANTLYALCFAVDNGSVVTASGTTSVGQIAGFASLNEIPRSANAGYLGYTYAMSFGTWTSDLSGTVPTETIALVPTGVAQAN